MVIVTFGEVVLQLLHHLAISSLVVSAKHRNSEVFTFLRLLLMLAYLGLSGFILPPVPIGQSWVSPYGSAIGIYDQELILEGL